MDDYIMEKLKGETLVDFENELQNNPAFANELVLHRQALAGIRRYNNRQLKKELKEIHKKVAVPMAKVRPMWYRYAVAAVIVLLIAAGIWYVLQPKNNEQLFAAYYQPYEISLTDRGEGNLEKIKKAEDAYLNKDYATALDLLEGLINEQEYNSQLHLATGIAYLEENKFEKAIGQFNIIIEKKDVFLKDQAVWYSALTLLKCNKEKEAETFLELLAGDEGADKHSDAKKLLEDLK